MGSGFQGLVHHGGKALLVGVSGCQEAEDNGAEDAFFLPSPERSLRNDPTYFRVRLST